MARFIIVLCAPLLFSLFSTSFAHKEEAVVEEPRQEQVTPPRITYPPEVKIHPPAVHFGIAFPVFALVLVVFYYLKGRNPDETEFLAILLASGSVLASSVTGYIAHESMEELPISKQALELLHTHETIGIALAVLFLLILLLRVSFFFKPRPFIHHLYALLLLAGVIALFFQGNLGGKLVYDFGLGVSR